MKTQIKIKDFTFEIEEDTMVDTFKSIASLQELFYDLVCSATIDGKKHTSDKVVLRVRKNKDEDEFYEVMCIESGPLFGYKKEFGVHKKGGGLFPKKKEADPNVILGHNGWFKWVGPKEEVKKD